MKLKLRLNKKKLKNLSKDCQVLPKGMTPAVVGGGAGIYLPPKSKAACP